MAKHTRNGPRLWRRRNYLINSAFQWKYTLVIATGVFLAASMMGIALFGSLHQQARARVLHPESIDAWQSARVVVHFAVAFSAVMVVALGCWGIVVTHRISGPLYVLGRHLTQLGEGQFPKRRPLRKKDEFKELHNTFWCTVDSLRARKRIELATLTGILNIASSAVKGDSQRRISALESIAMQVEAMRNEAAEALGDPADRPSQAPPTESAESAPDALALAEANV